MARSGFDGIILGREDVVAAVVAVVLVSVVNVKIVNASLSLADGAREGLAVPYWFAHCACVIAKHGKREQPCSVRKGLR